VTSAILKAQIAHAKARAAIGDCAAADQILNAAWADLANYSQSLAMRGLSPAGALSMHRMLAKAHTTIRKRCPGELLPPTYRSRGAPAGLIAPTFAPVHNPDLLAPSFRGAGGERAAGWFTASMALLSLGAIAFGISRMQS